MKKSTNRFILCALGVFIAYFYYGILQEKITRGIYTYETIDSKGQRVVETEKFTYALSLVFVQCAINFIVAHAVLYMWPQKEDKTLKTYYVTVSIAYMVAMVSSNMALQWISYPTQVVGKSAKPIPVMILGVLVGGKSYPVQKYVFVFLIVIGMVLFVLKDSTGGKNHSEISLGIGELLVLLSLTMDGLIGAVQERIRADSAPSGVQIMRSMNGYSTIFLAIAILGSREVFEFINFTSRHTYVLYNILLLGLVQVVGQMFLFDLISKYGALVVSIVTTTRKCFTVLASVLFFGNTLTLRQWSGAALVFIGLFLDIFFSKRKVPSKKNEDKQDEKKLTDSK